jgi:hypothetical protein
MVAIICLQTDTIQNENWKKEFTEERNTSLFALIQQGFSK